MKLPQEFIQRIQQSLNSPQAVEAFLHSLESSPIYSLRTNPNKPTTLPYPTTPIPWEPNGYYLKNRPSFVADPLFHAGAYYVQEASSMLIGQTIPQEKPLTILDLCAAPGGKSTLIAANMPKGSILITNEVIQSRAKILAENMTRWGNPNVIVTQTDPKQFAKLPNFFDLILIDAPCSGEGMFRKDPNSRNHWTPENVSLCAARQKRILANILPSLKPNGKLIYSTCTYASQENQQVIEWLLKEFPQLAPAPLSFPSEYGLTNIPINQKPNIAFQCYPHLVKGEGFFFASLKKISSNETLAYNTSINKRKKKNKHKKQPKTSNIKSIKQIAEQYTSLPPQLSLEQYEDKLFLIPPHIPQLVKAKIRIIKKGIYLGKLHRKAFAPSHELAVSNTIRKDLPSVQLPYNQAIEYLQRKDITPTSPPPIKKGWILIQYKNVNLGWAKVVNNKLKNQYPTNWRIRTQLP